MTVRNMDAIQRHGNMIAEQKRNAYKMVKDNFWKRIEIIRSTQADAVDAADTIEALGKNSLGGRFDKWDEQQNIHFVRYRGEFCISMNKCSIYYNPGTNHVMFAWSDCGMCESYSTAEYTRYAGGGADGERYMVECVTKGNRTYDNLLTAMAERLQPYLKAFFEWVETI